MKESYKQIKAELDKIESLILIYTNELGDSTRIESLKYDLETLNMQALELLNNDSTL